jgi:hypothetical protein
MREVRVGIPGKEITVDGNHSEKEENGKGCPRADSGPLGREKKNPKCKERDQKNPSLRKKRKVEMSEVNAGAIGDEDRNERKAKRVAHFRPKGIDFFSEPSIIPGPPPNADSGRPLHKPG